MDIDIRLSTRPPYHPLPALSPRSPARYSTAAVAIEGYIDEVSPTRITGWVYDSATPNAPVEVDIERDGVVLNTLRAATYRKDLKSAGKGNGRHGFAFETAQPGYTDLLARVRGTRLVLPRTGATDTGGRIQSEFLHPVEFGLPEAPYGFTPPPQLTDEPGTVRRLIDAFERALRDDPARRDVLHDMWSELADSYHASLLKLIRRRDVPGVADYLRDVHARPLTHGITQGEKASKAFRAEHQARRITSARYVDRLVSLAEYLGVLRAECVEQTSGFGVNLHTPPQQLVASIEAALGFPLAPANPPGGLFGIQTPAGVVSDRDLLALYAAIRLLEVARMVEVPRPAVVEIGGGAGGVAYYARRMGLADYTIIDLPLVNLLQGYCLICQLGPDAVELYGEAPHREAPHRESPRPAAPRIRLRPTWTFAADATHYDLLLNQDSFPEMHPDYATGYLRTAREKVRHFVLSINQEASAGQTATRLAGGRAMQGVVQDLASAVGGYRRVYRFRHWLRPGYIEELYRVA